MTNIVIILSVFCSALAQIFLKMGMTRFDVRHENNVDFLLNAVPAIALNPFIVLGVSLHVMALIAWLYVLKQVDVSYAYPFISLGFVFVLLISYQFFNETINLYKIAGIMSIIAGVFLISRS